MLPSAGAGAHHGSRRSKRAGDTVQTDEWTSRLPGLRPLLCGKALPFRCWVLLTNLIRAAEGIAFAAARMKRKGGRLAGKAEPFRIAGGEAPSNIIIAR